MSLLEMLGNNWLNNAEGNERKSAMCPQKCLVAKEKCPVCEEKQKRAMDAINELAELERTLQEAQENPEVLNQERATKCGLCGAPFEAGLRACPFCDTPYPADAVLGQIPKTKTEQEQFILKKAEETYDLIQEASSYIARGVLNKSENKTGLLSKLADGLMDAVENVGEMNGLQIKQCAQQYDVGYSEYLLGVAAGTYKTLGRMKLEEASAKMQEQQRQQQQQQLQRQQQQLARMKSQSQRTSMMGVFGASASRTPSYGVVPASSCCGSCVHYMSYQNECANNKYRHPSGASDYCGDYRSK